MSTTFSAEIERRIDEEMARGNYASADDLLRDALEALAAQRDDLAAIQAGIEDMQSGRTRPLAEVANEIRSKHSFSPGP